jgi:hypothetical protein
MNATSPNQHAELSDNGMTHTKGLPKSLVLDLRKSFEMSAFVETGTYMGGTTLWAAREFPRVITIEFSQHYYDKLKPIHSTYPNVEFVFGHSGAELERLVPSLIGPAVFWLDGHWSCEETYGEGDECPLFAELAAISRSPHEHFVFIDDARLFMAPPPEPHRPEQWPTIGQVLDALRAGGREPYIVIISDVIIACPPAAKSVLMQWSQATATAQHNEYLRKVAEEQLPKPVGRKQMLRDAATLAARALGRKAD